MTRSRQQPGGPAACGRQGLPGWAAILSKRTIRAAKRRWGTGSRPEGPQLEFISQMRAGGPAAGAGSDQRHAGSDGRRAGVGESGPALALLRSSCSRHAPRASAHSPPGAGRRQHEALKVCAAPVRS